MKFSITLLSLLLSFQTLFAQEQIPCEELLPMPFSFDFSEPEKSDKALLKMVNFLYCGLDEIDMQIIYESPIMSMILMELKSRKTKEQEVTYGDILNEFKKYKEEPFYLEVRKMLIASNLIESKKVDNKTWEEDKLVFQEMGMPDSIINEFHQLVLEYSGKDITFKELAEIYKNSNSHQSIPAETGFINPPAIDTSNSTPAENIFTNTRTEYTEALSKAREAGKPLLLFFTGYGCINARKMEDFILHDNALYQVITNSFHLLPIYVDDKAPLPNNAVIKSPTNGKTIRNLGNKNVDFQISRFQSNSQPLFVILDEAEKNLGMIGYTDRDAFLQFLKEGLKAFHE